MGLFNFFKTPSREEIRDILIKKYKRELNYTYRDNLVCECVIGIENYEKIKSIAVLKEGLKFYPPNLKSGDIKSGTFIYRENIKSIEIMDECEIQERSKLGQMVVIGLFALATKRKFDKKFQRMVVINIEEDGIKYSILIKFEFDTLKIAKKLNNWLKTSEFEYEY